MKGTVATHTDNSSDHRDRHPACRPWFSDNDQPTAAATNPPSPTRLPTARLRARRCEMVTVPFNKAVLPGAKDFDFDVSRVSMPMRAKRPSTSPQATTTSCQTVMITYKAARSTARRRSRTSGRCSGPRSAPRCCWRSPIRSAPNRPSTRATTRRSGAEGPTKSTASSPTCRRLLHDCRPAGRRRHRRTLPLTGSTPEQFGAVLDKGSALTPCVTAAVDALRADGELDTGDHRLSSQGAPS